MKKIQKNNKGITLVALVITIIVLIILAGITISSLTGSGLFQKAELAKQETEKTQDEENKTLLEYEDIVNGYINGIRDNIQTDAKYTQEQYEQYGNEKRAEGYNEGYNIGYTAGANETTGEGKYWEKTSVTFPTSGDSLTIDLGYIPTFICIKGKNVSGQIIFMSFDKCNSFYIANLYNKTSDTTNICKIVDEQIVFNPNTPSNWYGRTLDIYSIK